LFYFSYFYLGARLPGARLIGTCFMRILILIIHFLEKNGMFLIFSTMLVSLTISILSRYIFVRPMSWPDELSTYLFIAMTFLGASASIKTDSELKVNLLYERFPRWRKTLDVILHSVRLCVSIFFIVFGWFFVQVELVMATVSPILQIPVHLIFWSLPIFGIFMALRTIDCLMILFKGE
jgi:C4-dicarboxylate transporter, DctQ subunit